jgi:hypothetical protein
MSLLSAASTVTDAIRWWLVATCPCDRASMLPCRMLARELGPECTIGEVAARLICLRCRVRPSRVELVDNPQLDAPGYVANVRATRILICAD